MNIPKILIPTIVGISVSIIINKFFPEKVESLEKDPTKSLRGGSASRMELIKRITAKLLKDRALSFKACNSICIYYSWNLPFSI